MALITCSQCGKRLYKIHSKCPNCDCLFSQGQKTHSFHNKVSDIVLVLVIALFLPIIGFYGTDIISETALWVSTTTESRYEIKVGRLQAYLSQCTTGDPAGGNADRCVYLRSLTSRGYVENIPSPPKGYALVHEFDLYGYHNLEVKPIDQIQDRERNCNPEESTCKEIYF